MAKTDSGAQTCGRSNDARKESTEVDPLIEFMRRLRVEAGFDRADIPGPDHWRWRFWMAQRISEQLDPVRFGVVAVYLIGSTKNATAGPASDIDLLLHINGTEQQREKLMLWLEGWSRCLGEINYLRTGHRTDGLLDVHVVTDKDIAARSSFAVKINAITDPARNLPMKSTYPVRSQAESLA